MEMRDRWNLDSQLFVALQNNEVPKVADLLALGIDPDVRFHVGSQHRPALCLCAESQKLQLVELFLKWGCSVNQSDPVDGLTALHIAASHGSAPMVGTLLAHRAHVNAVTPRGLTPLHLASQTPYAIDVVRMLVDAGANLNSRDDEQKTALLNACIHGYADVASYLIDHGAEVDVVCPGDNNTPLLFVASSKHVDISLLERLLLAGARINGQNVRGESALHAVVRAQSRHRVEAINVLVAHGCNPDLRTNLGHTPLHLAVLHRDFVLAARLVGGAGCAVDLRDELGLSPLFYAVRDNNSSAVMLFLAAGVPLSDQKWLVAGDSTSAHDGHVVVPGRTPLEPALLRHLIWRSRQCASLANICRLTIRTRLASPVHENLDKLALPVPLQRYLKFEIL